MAKTKKPITVKALKETVVALVQVVPTPIEKLALDYTSEGLNNMARKINEIIDRMN